MPCGPQPLHVPDGGTRAPPVQVVEEDWLFPLDGQDAEGT
jgi:hypothetical protein